MKGKTVLQIGILLVALLYWVNLGAFVVNDLSDDYIEITNAGPSALAIGEKQSWANVAMWESGTGIAAIIGLVFFWAIAAIFLKSYKKESKVWKKVLVIIFNFFVLIFAIFQLIALLMTPGKKYMMGHYMFSYGTTGTFYILLLSALILVIGAIMLIVESIKLSNKTKEPLTEGNL